MADAHSRLAPPAAAIEAKAKPLFLPVLLASLSLNLAYVLRDAHAFAAQPATVRYSGRRLKMEGRGSSPGFCARCRTECTEGEHGTGAATSGVLREIAVGDRGKRWLTVPTFLFPLDERGFIAVNYSRVNGFAIDVGTSSTSPSISGVPWHKPRKGWMTGKRGAGLHVLMVEANRLSSRSIDLMTDPGFVSDAAHKRKTWGGCIDPVCNQRHFGATLYHATRWNMINAAASDAEGAAEFALGYYENVGTGSLFEMNHTSFSVEGSKAKRGYRLTPVATPKATPVPVIRLATLLQYIPPDAPIEVLKIDAQGFDAHILVGVPQDVLRRVKCVVAELEAFDDWHYVVDRKEPDVKAHLMGAGFVSIEKVWYNTAFKASFEQPEAWHYCYTWDSKWIASAEVARRMTAEVARSVRLR